MKQQYSIYKSIKMNFKIWWKLFLKVPKLIENFQLLSSEIQRKGFPCKNKAHIY